MAGDCQRLAPGGLGASAPVNGIFQPSWLQMVKRSETETPNRRRFLLLYRSWDFYIDLGVSRPISLFWGQILLFEVYGLAWPC